MAPNCIAQSQASAPSATVSISNPAISNDPPNLGVLYNKRLATFIPNYDADRGVSEVTDKYVAPVFTATNSHERIARWNPALTLQIEKFSKKDTDNLDVDGIKQTQRVWQVNGNRDQPIALVSRGTCIIKLPNQQFLYLGSDRWMRNRTFKADDPYAEEIQVGKGLTSKKFIVCGGVWADLKNVRAPYKDTVYFYSMEIEAKHKMFFSSCPKGSLEGCAMYRANATLSVIAKPKEDPEISKENKYGRKREYTPMAVLNIGDVIIEDQRAGQGLFSRLFTLHSPFVILSFLAALFGCC